jgi:hypothetical protein
MAGDLRGARLPARFFFITWWKLFTDARKAISTVKHAKRFPIPTNFGPQIPHRGSRVAWS